jgi:hypothetical protein
MNSKLFWRAVLLLIIGIAAASIAFQPPAWMILLFGSSALAGLYIVARLRSGYDSLDPRFGGCIPPISTPKDR